MSNAPEFICGVVEGYYGRPWPSELRLRYADYLAALGLNTFLYCPKADPFLRKRWQEQWPQEEWSKLKQLAGIYHERDLNFGLGLSPYALYQEYGPNEQSSLRRKVLDIASLGTPLLALLFDDMPGDMPDLAERQARIAADVQQWCPQIRLLICPTYYSCDPALEKHFGRRPENYWEELGAALSPAIDIFWTGNKVCSDTIVTGDVEGIGKLLGRKVILWDNYPVNDGATRSNFLYLESLPGREAGLRGKLNGHLCNPMNQGLLSLPAFAGLSALYGCGDQEQAWLSRALGQQTWGLLQRDKAQFESLGLSGLGEESCSRLADQYSQLNEPAAVEVAAWLRGEYTFDPACLTD